MKDKRNYKQFKIIKKLSKKFIEEEFFREYLNRFGTITKTINSRRLLWYTLDGINPITSKDLFNLYHNINTPKCKNPECNNDALFINFNEGYRKCCSIQCSGKLDERKIKRQQTNLKKYGVTEPFNTKESKSKAHKIMSKKYNWTPIEELPDFKKYKKEVYKITRNQSIHTLEYSNKQGFVTKENSYHLDHIFSIKEGFDKNILPIYIGNINNLQFIPSKENISKGSRSDITLEELFQSFKLT